MTTKERPEEWIEYDPEAAEYEIDLETAPYATTSGVLMAAIDRISDTPVEDLPLLFRQINPDALNHLGSAPDTDTTAAQIRVKFSYADFTIFVHIGDSIVLSPESTSM